MKHLHVCIGHLTELLNRSNELVNSIAKGMILGNVINSNGGGVYVEAL